MPQEILVKTGIQIVFANTADFDGTIPSLGLTDQLDLTGLLAGVARQSTKADLGATRAAKYNVFAAIEFVGASGVVAGDEISLYFGFSPSANPANANPAGLTGADSDYAGSVASSLDESLRQLEKIGSLVTILDNTPTVQYQKVGEIFTIGRYVSCVVYNETSANFVGNGINMFVMLEPIIDEAQDVV